MVFVERTCAIDNFVALQRGKRMRPGGSHDLWPFSTPALLTGQPCPADPKRTSTLFAPEKSSILYSNALFIPSTSLNGSSRDGLAVKEMSGSCDKESSDGAIQHQASQPDVVVTRNNASLGI